MANLSPENEAKLRKAIAKSGLKGITKLVVASSVETAIICDTVRDDYLQVGNSRSGGVPDLPDESWWPKTPDGKFYDFYQQINLADVPNFIGNVLPRWGMLYCFMGGFGKGRTFDTRILWADVSPSEIKRMKAPSINERVDWNGKKMEPYKIRFHVGIDLPKSESAIRKRLGNSSEGVNVDRYESLADEMQACDGRFGITGKLLGDMKSAVWDFWDVDEGDTKTEPETTEVKKVKTDDEYYNRPANAWQKTCDTPLWLFQSPSGVGLLDAGWVQIFINGEALKKHDFSYVGTYLDSA